MMFEDLYTYLSKSITVYPDELPLDVVYPAVTYQLIYPENLYTMTGNANLTTYNIQYKIFATSRLDTITQGNILKTALDGYQGTMGTTNIQSVFINTEDDDVDKQNNVYTKIIEFKITVKGGNKNGN